MLGILGGTFDPIHNGHLNAAIHVYNTLKLDELRFMPCNHPPHRKPPIASAQDRINMIKLAIKNYPGFIIDDRELKSNEISYTVNSLSAIRQEVGNTTVCLILGYDAFSQLHTWHESKKIIQLAHIIVVDRPDKIINKNEFLKYEITDPNELKKQNAGFVYFENNIPINISSTLIRNKLKNKEELNTLLPATVLNYIEKMQLYS